MDINSVLQNLSASEIAALMKGLQERKAEIQEKERQERQGHMDAITQTLADAAEDLVDDIKYFGGRVPVLLVVDEKGKVNVEGRFSSPSTGAILSTGARHGRVKVGDREYPTLNSALREFFPDRKIGTEVGVKALQKAGQTVTFLDK